MLKRYGGANEQVIPKEQNANTETNRNKSENTAHYSIGFGVSMMTIDDYIGADESRFYFIPTPYIYYQNDSVVIDRNAFEGDLFNNKNGIWHWTQLALFLLIVVKIKPDKVWMT